MKLKEILCLCFVVFFLIFIFMKFMGVFCFVLFFNFISFHETKTFDFFFIQKKVIIKMHIQRVFKTLHFNYTVH